MSPAASSIRTSTVEASIVEASPVTWIERNGLRVLGVAIGVVFVWFGLLKPLVESPAVGLIAKTLPFLPSTLALHVVGWWEVATGVCILVPQFARAAVFLLAIQLPALLVPFIVVPDVCFAHVPYALTLEGESLIKSLLLVVAGVVVAEAHGTTAACRRA